MLQRPPTSENQKQQRPAYPMAYQPSCLINKLFKINNLCYFFGGESGIRTHGRLTPTAVFKTAALNHSAISP